LKGKDLNIADGIRCFGLEKFRHFLIWPVDGDVPTWFSGGTCQFSRVPIRKDPTIEVFSIPLLEELAPYAAYEARKLFIAEASGALQETDLVSQFRIGGTIGGLNLLRNVAASEKDLQRFATNKNRSVMR